MSIVTNPILPGFHPDPCILRVGDDYYIATSTFEWWPGVQIHHSRDLANWSLAGYALTRRSQIDLRGIPPSGGVWAPALSHADGLFWLIYSDVKAFNGCSKDVVNYLVTAPSISGPWSEPVRLNSSGFDPSLFHDDDGRKWLVNQIWDSRPDKNQFAGIALQEYDHGSGKLVGKPVAIFRGSSIGVTEGPHLYKRDGFYYLVTAEGGTGEAHAVTVARARTLAGPYQLSPYHPLLTSAGHAEARLRKAGHGSFVQTPDGHWFLAHLCSRPFGQHRRCFLGRETALQPVDWPAGDWPRLSSGLVTPAETWSMEGVDARPYLEKFEDDFSAGKLNLHWNTLRESADESWLSLRERPGALRLRGRHTLMSCFDQSLVGFRLLHASCRVRVRLDFGPESFQQSAGLSFYYSTSQFFSLMVTGRQHGGRELRLLLVDGVRSEAPANACIQISDTGEVALAAVVREGRLQFSYGLAEKSAVPIGPELDLTLLSDERVIENGSWGFTGTFITLNATDSGDAGIPADFQDFSYEALRE